MIVIQSRRKWLIAPGCQLQILLELWLRFAAGTTKQHEPTRKQPAIFSLVLLIAAWVYRGLDPQALPKRNSL